MRLTRLPVGLVAEITIGVTRPQLTTQVLQIALERVQPDVLRMLAAP